MYQSRLAINGQQCSSLPLARRSSKQQHVARATMAPVDLAHCEVEMFEECFVFGELLGCGSFAEVKLATRRDTREEYAVKTVSKSQHASSGLPPEIENWQRVLASEHVAKLEAVYEDEHSYHLVQELCYGGDLQSYLERFGRLDEQEAAQAMQSVLRFLADCHAERICYGDVKPSNFLLKSMYPSIHHLMDPTKPKGKLMVKAADLGSSQQFHPALKLRRTVGTLMYIAPEIWSHSYGAEVDIWSAGVMMFQLLTARFPFWDVNAEFVQRLGPDLVTPTIRNAEVIYSSSIWSALSPEAFDLVSSMLQKDPKRRISAEQALLHPWFQKQAGSSSSQSASVAAPGLNNIVPMPALQN